GIMVWIGVNEKFSPTVVGRDHQKKLLEKWRLLLSGPGVMITYNMRFLSQLGRMMIIPIIPLFIGTIRTYAIGVNTFTGLVIAAGSAATTLSAIYLGRLGDRVGHRQIVISAIFIAGLLYLPLSLVFEGWQLAGIFPLSSPGWVRGRVESGVEQCLSALGTEDSIVLRRAGGVSRPVFLRKCKRTSGVSPATLRSPLADDAPLGGKAA
ncbi:MAG: hypothetical protein IIA67_10475, partial [Planctomycetes bacterium]|nr:hypothetical protein [Planctomycetota bacterium]